MHRLQEAVVQPVLPGLLALRGLLVQIQLFQVRLGQRVRQGLLAVEGVEVAVIC